jgi:Ca-activated chloride channel family protein
MARIHESWIRCRARRCVFLALLVVAAGLADTALGQQGERTQIPDVCQGSLLFRSPVSGVYESIPLVHTDATFDVRGLVAAGTITQKYENSSSAPIEAVYVFPLPHDAAVYDMEIRIGNRVIRSKIRERAEAKQIYEAAKAAGKHTALVEEERPNIFTTSVANIMPGDRIDVRLRYVEALRWEEGRMRLEFPMVVGPRYIPGTQATGHAGTGWAKDTDAVPDASRITPISFAIPRTGPAMTSRSV